VNRRTAHRSSPVCTRWFVSCSCPALALDREVVSCATAHSFSLQCCRLPAVLNRWMQCPNRAPSPLAELLQGAPEEPSPAEFSHPEGEWWQTAGQRSQEEPRPPPGGHSRREGTWRREGCWQRAVPETREAPLSAAVGQRRAARSRPGAAPSRRGAHPPRAERLRVQERAGTTGPTVPTHRSGLPPSPVWGWRRRRGARVVRS
jgi:hypothetical protein